MSALIDWIRDNKARAASLGFLLALCVLIGLMAWHARRLRLPARPTAAAVAVPAAPATSPLPAPLAEPGRRTARMRAEFEGATDYLAFIQVALGRPQEGGKFYALLAWERCDARRSDDADKRCAGVKTQYPDLQTLYRVATELRGGRDALLPDNGRGFVSPVTRETAQADVDAAIRSGDRYAIAHAMNANRQFLDLAGSDGAPRAADGAACTAEGGCREAIDKALACATADDCPDEELHRLLGAPPGASIEPEPAPETASAAADHRD